MDKDNTLNEDTKPFSEALSESENKKSVIVDPQDDEIMIQAGKIIRSGGLVSFPTETVYGLGANALDVEAATSIFTTKERPMTDPLIVHIASREDAYELIDVDENILEIFNILGDRFWPGPFTCVVNANKEKISPVITADTGYVGIRCPNNPVALKLIQEAGRPIAAPSANKFGHVSPTKAEHVLADFKNDNVFILDGGSCDFGIESTVVKVYYEETSTPEQPHINLLILRRGGVSEQEFRKVISECKLTNSSTKLTVECVEKKHFTEESHKMEAPGQFLRHYAPNLPSYMLSKKRIDEDDISNPLNLSKCVLLDFNSENIKLKDEVSLYLDLSEKGDYIEAINHVYDYLRISETQEEGEMVIIADLFNESSKSGSSHAEHASALFDRLFRAVTGNCILTDAEFSEYTIKKL